MTDSSRILFVDGDEDCCQMMSIIFKMTDQNLAFVSAGTADEALSLIEAQKFDLYILDYWLPDATGIELCGKIRQSDAQTPIVIYSGMAREIDRRSAEIAGVSEYLIKPNDLEKLTRSVTELLKDN
jgi:DNA-binding response OmpR family regulator